MELWHVTFRILQPGLPCPIILSLQPIIVTPRAPAEETRDAYLTRLRAACAHVNDNFDVAGLNRELPGRVQQLLELKGDKLRK